MSNNLSRKMIEKLQGKLQVDQGQLRALAGKVNKNDFADETKLRQLIKTLVALTGTSISEEKEDKIIQMFRENKVNPNDFQALAKLLK
ncbi:stage VI sporulation protein F [Brevibacillus fulvus]|uniref:Uncharacterized protein YegL n=1 Tax=Brevibacillus fulvus TaxID=1125967 RepID=A0A938XVY0_9BACL|nr:stage VI sporulation protein F [Brevibacillus fulvus]MBM7588695.1 uncharacterized protein YegL [Brevibacillus fulvus]